MNNIHALDKYESEGDLSEVVARDKVDRNVESSLSHYQLDEFPLDTNNTCKQKREHKFDWKIYKKLFLY